MRFAYEDNWMPDILPYENIGVYDVWKYKKNYPSKSICCWKNPMVSSCPHEHCLFHANDIFPL